MMSTFQALALILDFLTLFFLAIYVKKTIDIAKATGEHNQIITRPAVTVSLFGDSSHPWQPDHIWVLVQNHTPIHAKMKIGIQYEKVEDLHDLTLKTSTPITVGHYNGNNVWNISAMDRFQGHTSLTNLQGEKLKPNERIVLNIAVQVSPFDSDDYRPNPLRQYRWNDTIKEWIPTPVLS